MSEKEEKGPIAPEDAPAELEAFVRRLKGSIRPVSGGYQEQAEELLARIEAGRAGQGGGPC